MSRVAALAEAGYKVAVLSKVFPTRSHTERRRADRRGAWQHGRRPWMWHMYDTIIGSDWLGVQDAIEFLCRERRRWSSSSSTSALPFDRNANGTVYQPGPVRAAHGRFGAGRRAAFLLCGGPHRHAMLQHCVPANVRASTAFWSSGWRGPDPRRSDRCWE